MIRFPALLLALAMAALPPRPAAAQSPHSHAHSFGDAEKWAKVFDDPQRDAWQKPPKAARIAPEQVTSELKRAGYSLEREHGFLPNQYFLIFRPALP